MSNYTTDKSELIKLVNEYYEKWNREKDKENNRNSNK